MSILRIVTDCLCLCFTSQIFSMEKESPDFVGFFFQLKETTEAPAPLSPAAAEPSPCLSSSGLGSLTNPRLPHQLWSLSQGKNAYVFLPKLMQLRGILSKLVSVLHKAKYSLYLHVSHRSCERKQHLQFCKLPVPESCTCIYGNEDWTIKIKKNYSNSSLSYKLP